jgi:ribose 5-phosphate isomerase B
VDYPDFAKLVANDVQKGFVWRGVLICGTGIGMALAANRFSGVRAASLTDISSAKMARAHNDLNLLCLGARVVATDLAEKILKIFLETEFQGGRHQKRLEKIE